MSRVIGDRSPRPSAGVFLLVAPVVAVGVDGVAGDTGASDPIAAGALPRLEQWTEEPHRWYQACIWCFISGDAHGADTYANAQIRRVGLCHHCRAAVISQHPAEADVTCKT